MAGTIDPSGNPTPCPSPPVRPPGRLTPGRRKGKIRARFARFFVCRALRGKRTTGREAPRLQERSQAINGVRLDPQQVPTRAELLLAAELGADAPGRPIYARPERDGQGDGVRMARIKVGAAETRRVSAAEATETPAGAACGNPLRGRPERASSVPIVSALIVGTNAADARGWRVCRVTPAVTVIYDERIDHGAANGELAVAQLRAAAPRSPEAALRRATASRGDHVAASGVAERLANVAIERVRPKKPGSRAGSCSPSSWARRAPQGRCPPRAVRERPTAGRNSDRDRRPRPREPSRHSLLQHQGNCSA